MQTKYNIYDEEIVNEDADAEANGKDPPLLKCDNCFRHEIPNCTSYYALNLSSILSSDIAVLRPYSNLKGTRSQFNIMYACNAKYI